MKMLVLCDYVTRTPSSLNPLVKECNIAYIWISSVNATILSFNKSILEDDYSSKSEKMSQKLYFYVIFGFFRTHHSSERRSSKCYVWRTLCANRSAKKIMQASKLDGKLIKISPCSLKIKKNKKCFWKGESTIKMVSSKPVTRWKEVGGSKSRPKGGKTSKLSSQATHKYMLPWQPLLLEKLCF